MCLPASILAGPYSDPICTRKHGPVSRRVHAGTGSPSAAVLTQPQAGMLHTSILAPQAEAEQDGAAPVREWTAPTSSCVRRSWICSRRLQVSSSASSVPGASGGALSSMTISTRASPKKGSMWCSHCEAKRRLASCAHMHARVRDGQTRACERFSRAPMLHKLKSDSESPGCYPSSDFCSTHTDRVRCAQANWQRRAHTRTTPCGDGLREYAIRSCMPSKSGAFGPFWASAAAALCL